MNIGLLIVRRALEYNVFITVFGRAQENKAAASRDGTKNFTKFQKENSKAWRKKLFEVQKMFWPVSTFYSEMPSNESKVCK